MGPFTPFCSPLAYKHQRNLSLGYVLPKFQHTCPNAHPLSRYCIELGILDRDESTASASSLAMGTATAGTRYRHKAEEASLPHTHVPSVRLESGVARFFQHHLTHSSQSCCGDQRVRPCTNEDNIEARRGLSGSKSNSSAVTTATWGTKYAGHCAVTRLTRILSPSSQQPSTARYYITPDSQTRKRTEFKEPDPAELPYCPHSMCPSPPSPFLCGGGRGYQRRSEEGHAIRCHAYLSTKQSTPLTAVA